MNLEEIRQGNLIEVSFGMLDYMPSRIIKVSDIEECTSASIGFEDSLYD